MAYAVKHISGGHFNPTVSFGLMISGRFSDKKLIPYILAQCIGAIAAAASLYFINNGVGSGAGTFPTNSYEMEVYLEKVIACNKHFLLNLY